MTSERTTTCCFGDVFFRKRRFSPDAYVPSLKPKTPLEPNEQPKVRLEGSTCQTYRQLQLHSETSRLLSADHRTLPPQTVTYSSSSSKLLHTPDSYGTGSRPTTSYPSTPEGTLISGTIRDTMGRNSQPVGRGYGSNGPPTTATTSSAGMEPPPKYTPPRAPLTGYETHCYLPPLKSTTTTYASETHCYLPPLKSAVDECTVEPRRVKRRPMLGGASPAPVATDDAETMLQNLWIENQQQNSQKAEEFRPAILNGGLRNSLILDTTTNTTYKRGRLLGKGGFARCYEMTDLKTNVVYAGKVISKLRISKPRQREKIMREVELHRTMQHPHVVEFHSFFEDEQNIYFILENCSKKSLVDILKTRHTLTEPEVRYYMAQLVTGCRYIHSKNVIHRDLKLGNMLLNEGMQVKIADFGLATRVEYKGEKKMTVCGTPNYIAPEVIQRRGHSFEADIWSIGCIMYTMLCGRPPFETNTLKETYERIGSNHYLIPDHVSAPAADLITRLLSNNPANRPSLDGILRHDFFRSGHMPSSLDPSSSYSVPKFPLFIPPRPRSYAAPTPAPAPLSSEVRTINQNFQRGNSQRSAVRVRRTNPTPVTKVELKVEIEKSPLEVSLTQTKLPRTSTLTRHDSSNRLCSAIRLYKMLSACLDVMPPDSFPTPVIQAEPLWVTKWVDYSNKYGFGYQLSDGSVGILYNDTTRMALLADGRTLQYNDLSNRVVTLSKDVVPSDLQKKVTLLIYFSQYMDEHLISGGVDAVIPKSKMTSAVTGSDASDEKSEDLVITSGLTTTAVFMKKWFRSERAIVMHLNNGTLQVNFFDDHAKLVISVEAQDYLVTHITADRQNVAYRLLQLRHFGCSADLMDRLSYARDSLKTIINVGSEAV